MSSDFDRTPLSQQSFVTLIGSASCGIGVELSRQIPSIRHLTGRIYFSSVVLKGQDFQTRWMDMVMADSALATAGILI